MPVCPFFKNPLSAAKCYLTQSLQHDTLKMKAVGDAVNGLDNLGLVTRIDGEFEVTSQGEQIASLDYVSPEFLTLLREQLNRCGAFMGFLHLGLGLKRGQVLERHIIKPHLGFPETGEYVNGVLVSSGCSDDTRTRTGSVLTRWAMTGGFLATSKLKGYPRDPAIHVTAISEQMGINTVKHFELCYRQNLFDGAFIDRPIEHSFMTPLPGARRDSDQSQRDVSMAMSVRIRNRRLALAQALDEARRKSKNLSFEALINALGQYSHFVIDESSFDRVMTLELRSVTLIGALWQRTNDNLAELEPLTTLNRDVLQRGCNPEVLGILDDIFQDEPLFI